ncbi:glyoxylase-like metal-dependent hydrolase (beta-lactamase superfamily II) [Spinactinospora alkalitolerans]|uniref:Glyoxylase-like metal-dependent hydrolase (Beta-lactamase superfamily II) n=1 Tax=Spinactinospora alkalitolerans TaxID=687207 RepID=A0A852TTF9_9ACTN|nr:MBL fold metallo-hydrolase [Spinactinospora alkalitolerans]NYE46587.1 glyoxylase-like metal-dependent hydrolase (beta-lactamase superfamily II) [Spinactinospora alkalitolerans]
MHDAVDATQRQDITPLGDEIFAIDTRMAGYPGITSSYLIRTERPCVIEVGTAGSAPVLRDALADLGIEAADLATIVVTHIHLDHAGGVGDIARMFPNAEIVVHRRGARHLADPARLMSSARMVWGDRLDVLFGEMRPTEAGRIRAVDTDDEVDLGGGRRLTAHYSPGHAKHHVGLVDSTTGDLYVGDAVGVYNTHTGDVRPATPPPDFDLDAALGSLRLFTDIDPQRLMFSHFGAVDSVAETLHRADEELRMWVETVREAHAGPGDLDHAVAMVRERVVSRYRPLPESAPAESQKVMDILSGVESNVAGITHWLDQVETDQREARGTR